MKKNVIGAQDQPIGGIPTYETPRWASVAVVAAQRFCCEGRTAVSGLRANQDVTRTSVMTLSSGHMNMCGYPRICIRGCDD